MNVCEQVDWSAGNLLSVGLGACVYLWSACTSQVRDKLETQTATDVTVSNELVNLHRWRGCVTYQWRATLLHQCVGMRGSAQTSYLYEDFSFVIVFVIVQDHFFSVVLSGKFGGCRDP